MADDGGSSLFHRRLKAEFDDVLRCSMQTRLTNLREEAPPKPHISQKNPKEA